MKYSLIACLALMLLLSACAPSQPLPEPELIVDVEPEPENELSPEPPLLDRTVDPSLYIDPILYDCDGINIAIPSKYADQLLIDPQVPEGYEHQYTESGEDKPLISVYHKDSFEVHPGAGWLFDIWRYTTAQYEQYLTGDMSGQSFFAKDDNRYYGFFFATDVQTPDMADAEEYWQLFIKVGDFVLEDILTRNGLEPYGDEKFFNSEYTYAGEHMFLKYFPYLALTGKRDIIWTLVLSQPVKQGEGGIWCVERWFEGVDMSKAPATYPCAPDTDKAAADYYAELQAACDAEHNISLLDPYQVGLEFVKAYLGHGSATVGSFELDSKLEFKYSAARALLKQLAIGNVEVWYQSTYNNPPLLGSDGEPLIFIVEPGGSETELVMELSDAYTWTPLASPWLPKNRTGLYWGLDKEHCFIFTLNIEHVTYVDGDTVITWEVINQDSPESRLSNVIRDKVFAGIF